MKKLNILFLVSVWLIVLVSVSIALPKPADISQFELPSDHSSATKKSNDNIPNPKNTELEPTTGSTTEPSGPIISCGPFLKCPPGAVSCVYIESTTTDRQFIERNSTCTAKDGSVIHSNSEKIPNESNVVVSKMYANSFSGNVGNLNSFADLFDSFDLGWLGFK